MLILLLALSTQTPAAGDWPVYGRDPGGARSSPLTQVTRDNVAHLTVAWTWHANLPDMSGMSHRPPALEVTPIVVDGTMYVITPVGIVVANLVVTGSGIADNSGPAPASGEVRAFDARTGALRWTFDPVPQDSMDPAYQTWQGGSARHTGAANVWSVMVADPVRDLIFL